MIESKTEKPGAPSSESVQNSPTRWGTPVWILAGLLAVGVLSVTASYAPPVMKRLVVFYLVYGIACGYVLNWLAQEIRPRIMASRPLIAALLCLLGAMNMGFLSFRNFEQARQQLARERPKDIEILEALDKASQNDPDAKEQYATELRQYKPQFNDYLQFRTKELGKWPAPWPLVFWIVELLLAAVSSGISLSWMQLQSQQKQRDAKPRDGSASI